MPQFLIDENLSPLLSDYLRSLNFDAKAARDVGLKGKSDEEIIKWIQRNKRVLITADSDFGEFFYLKTFGQIGVIILKSKSQQLKSFKEVIDYLYKEKILKSKKLENSLIIAIKGKYRIRKYIET
ncbi:MAG: hypothetical protein COY72_00420 [Candidatus Nealsonbacteria bacterium CG_4_10_14_0_8_um_filter_35_10]|uniref:DUF5615 domain-containing protein n=1 Tax=Candidatus Nealsonbacteria bacterium CG_4_10_14_0_8_um_filter_35_10 TaxID=1974683 RepID=A0A2M7R8L7_9BACT|nr:MAG: hypothetical protein AUJ24_01505 [Parcubacteria group bacterium CG1_02_36_42]PIY91015.1 MAG: hypothetical protein COY72_00420 [Candidatus Nealsonbacteria bacterium CG_4_10_14_0_8_um_filter_35_10]